MSLNDEAVRLALLGRADKRAKERTLNVPQSRVQERKAYDTEITGGSHKAKYESEEKMATHGGSLVGSLMKKDLKGMIKSVKAIKEKAKEVKGGAGADMSNSRLVGGAKKAMLLGRQYAREMADLDDEVKAMRGGAMMTHFHRGLMEGLGMTGGAGLQDDTAYQVAFETGKTQTGGGKGIQGAEMLGRHSRAEDSSLTEEQAERLEARGGERTSMAFPDAVRPKSSGGAKLSKAELQRHGVEPGACDVCPPKMEDSGKRRRFVSEATRSRLKSRGDMIRKIMREKGVSLPEASRMLKEMSM